MNEDNKAGVIFATICFSIILLCGNLFLFFWIAGDTPDGQGVDGIGKLYAIVAFFADIILVVLGAIKMKNASREVTKKSGKRFRDELYTFSEGTAVNIRYDNQGKIAMELGGIDSADRLPSSSEASRLGDEMVAFCDKFTEFEKRLSAKGIVCKNRVSHLPPKAEYAQIINTSDYDMKTDVETFKAERRSEKGESKKQHRNE